MNEMQKLHNDINKKKKDANIPVEIINRLRATLGTPQFKEIVKHVQKVMSGKQDFLTSKTVKIGV
ncbi:2478_t:CDS:2, partial [Racocetra fulgida]